MVVVKCCSGCGVVKSLDDFHRDRTKPDGRRPWCKECASTRRRRYYEDNHDKVREYSRRYYEENRDKVLEYSRRYREENHDKALESTRRWREDNHDKVREYSRRYRDENREKIAERNRQYRAENLDKELERVRQYREENREYMNRQISRSRNRYQSVTESAATKRGPWSEAEIAILMADDGRTLVAKALELGRTYSSCCNKHGKLRRTGATN